MPGHAFRIGGATELLLQGVHPDIVSTQGRWLSDTFLEYWHRIDTILPLFITSSANTERLLDLDCVMDSFAHQHRLPRTTALPSEYFSHLLVLLYGPSHNVISHTHNNKTVQL